MIINHNLAANNAIRNMNINSGNASKSMQKLSSGLRINSAADDAAGLAISEKMRGQIRGLDQASSNAQDGISMIQTAEGALNETQSILQRMRELAVQSSTDTNTDDDRSKIQSEVDQLAKEITRVSNTSEFNTQNLLAGGLNDTFHIGANEGQNINISVNAMDAQSLGVAGNSVKATSFTANASGITGVTSVSRGITASDVSGYKIEVAATASAATNFSRTAGTGGTALIAGNFTVSGYTGTTDATYKIELSKVSDAGANTSNHIDQIRYSKDGGTSWTTVDTTGAGATTAASFDGITVALADVATDGAYKTDDKYSVDISAAKATLQLKDNTGTAIGNAVEVKYGSTSAELGLAKNNQAVDVNFKFSSLANATGATAATFNLDVTASTAATTREGKVITDATVQNGIDVSTQKAASSAITTINNAITKVSEERAKLGAYSNRLEHTIANLGTSSENLTSSESRIRDVDMAKEMSTFSKNNILSQAAQAMLAQANNQPQQVLQLLR